MNRIIYYKYEVELKSPLYIGGMEQGKLLTKTNKNPFITGNTLAGCIRSFLKDEDYLFGLGGEIELSEKGEKEFIESEITVADGIFKEETVKKDCKEGTKVEARCGTADDGSKYKLEYISGGIFTFELFRECNNQDEFEVFKALAEKIAIGISNEKITIGGQVNNGFGRLSLKQFMLKQFDLESEDGLNAYIFLRNEENYEVLNIDRITEELHDENIVITVKGEFPYGVYQNYDIKNDVTRSGLQKNSREEYYIPATSIKGLLRSEVEKLYFLNKLNGEEIVKELFGSSKKRGKLKVDNVIIENNEEITSYTSDEIKISTYNKIDRLTGGCLDGSLFNQIEIEGSATIKMELDKNHYKYLYPILIVLKEICLGYIPIGGRTSIGLGEFEGRYISVNANGKESTISFDNGEIKLEHDEELIEKTHCLFMQEIRKGEV